MPQRSLQIQQGDTLSKLAQTHGVNVSDFSGFRSGDPNKIFAGETVNFNAPDLPRANSIPAEAIGGPSLTAPPNVPKTGFAGLIESTNSVIKEVTPLVDDDTKKIKDTFDKLGSKNEERVDSYTDTGVYDKQKTYNNLVNTMNAKDLASRRRIEKIRNENPGGQLASGQQIAIQKEERRWASEKADLAIAAAFAQDDFTLAKSIVDDRIDAETEDLRNELEGLSFFFTQNSNKLTEAQKNLLQQETKQIELELATTEDLLKEKGGIQLEAAQNGAPAAVILEIGRAGDITAAISAAGQYIGLLDRQRENRLGSDSNSSVVAIAPEDKRILTGAGFDSAGITDLQNSVRDFGVQAVLDNLDSDEQKAAVKKVYNIEDEAKKEFELTREAVASFYGVTDDATQSRSFFGLKKNKSGKDTIDEVMAFAEKYRQIGKTDAQIRDLLLKQ